MKLSPVFCVAGNDHILRF